MRNSDIWLDLAAACALLTRLPLRAPDAAFKRGARSTWAFPIVGALTGGLAAGTGCIALAIGLPAPIAALAAMAITTITTGAIHEDGLADSADGLWGGWSPERRLEIMKDSQIGSYGVIALIFAMAARWVAITTLLTTAPLALMAAAALSRAVMPVVMATLPHARSNGLSHATGRPNGLTVVIGLAIAILICLLTTPQTPLLLIIAATTTATVALIAKRKINGQTGDILGATQQVTEIALLTALI